MRNTLGPALALTLAACGGSSGPAPLTPQDVSLADQCAAGTIMCTLGDSSTKAGANQQLLTVRDRKTGQMLVFVLTMCGDTPCVSNPFAGRPIDWGTPYGGDGWDPP